MSRRKVKSPPRRSALDVTDPLRLRAPPPRTLTVLHGGLEPIEITTEMIDLVITTAETQQTMVNHLRRGYALRVG